MLIVLATLYNLTLPYWDTLKKELAQRNISSLTILHAPNLLIHPFGIAALLILGLFTLPQDPIFYLSWFGMIGIASFSLVLNLWGLLHTQFFGAQVLGRLGFLADSLAAIVFLGERVTTLQTLALACAALAIFLFAWPKRTKNKAIIWDRGVFYILLALTIDAFSNILYKFAALHTLSYESFLTGRFIGDLIGWTIVWLIGVILISKLNPLKELGRCIDTFKGWVMIVGVAASALLSSWLIFKLPVITYAMLGTLMIPGAYLWSHYKYKEHISVRMWIGTVVSFAALILYLY